MVRALHQHHTGVGSISAGGPTVVDDKIFSTAYFNRFGIDPMTLHLSVWQICVDLPRNDFTLRIGV